MTETDEVTLGAREIYDERSHTYRRQPVPGGKIFESCRILENTIEGHEVAITDLRRRINPEYCRDTTHETEDHSCKICFGVGVISLPVVEGPFFDKKTIIVTQECRTCRGIGYERDSTGYFVYRDRDTVKEIIVNLRAHPEQFHDSMLGKGSGRQKP